MHARTCRPATRVYTHIHVTVLQVRVCSSVYNVDCRRTVEPLLSSTQGSLFYQPVKQHNLLRELRLYVDRLVGSMS